MTTDRLTKLGRLTALLSFLFGTMIFVFYFLTSSSNLLFVGYAYILIVGLLNLVILILLLIRIPDTKGERMKLLKTCGLILLNIPAMIIYCYNSLYMTGILRIQFRNETENELTEIKINGCETKSIQKLSPNEVKTIWIGIPRDCSVDITYIVNGQLKQETVSGYMTPGMGQRIKYNIGGKNDELF